MTDSIRNLTEGQQQRTQQALQETDVGITTYASPIESSLECLFKQRYTDFQVNEILPDGTVLHLTEIATPPIKKSRKDAQGDEDQRISKAGEKRPAEDDDKDIATKKQKIDDTVNTTEAAPSTIAITTEDKTSLITLFGETVTTAIIQLYDAVITQPSRKPRDHVSVKTEIIESKATRTQAHLAIRKIFDCKLQTETSQDEPGRMSIRAAATQQEQSQNGRVYDQSNGAHGKKTRVHWDELGGEYLHFTLYKENKDTMEALYFMASELRVKINTFTFAGTKDRRGVTVQRVSGHRIHKERLMHLSKIARGWKIGDFEYKKKPLQLGDLQGNEFVITLRGCRVSGLEDASPAKQREAVDEVVKMAASHLGEHGYINFYGLQRFGSHQTGTHIVGMKILQNDLQSAIDCILAYDPAVLPKNLDEHTRDRTPRDDIDRAEAIRIWRETQNVNNVRSRMPKRFHAENNIIQYLGRKADGHTQEKDWQGALMCIQRGLRLMYVHAYQSFVWNKAACMHKKLYGNTVVEGDLVVVGDKEDAVPEDKTDQDGEVVVHPTEEEGSGEDAFVRARPLSKEEAESGRWNIFDIVLPLPGWDVLLPSNDLGKFYEDFMGSEEGGRLDPHDMRRAWKDASLSGGYRKMMSRPLGGKVEVETHIYRGEQQLAPTDVDRLGQGLPEATAEGEEQIAVVLKLQLGSSQYATMALRELTMGGALAYRPDFSADRQRGR